MQQAILTLASVPRGIHLITNEVEHFIKDVFKLPDAGLLHLFIQHTSAGICINENADSSVRRDMEKVFDLLVKENETYYEHTMEGPDDMPAHVKSVLTGHTLTIPIVSGRLGLGTWQGIYLCEFRNRATARRLVLTVF